MMISRKLLSLGISTLALVVTHNSAMAHEAQPADVPPTDEEALAQPEATEGLEEIIVTAQRRDQSLQDVPISVSVMTGAELEARQVTNIATATTFVPNVSVGSSTGDPTDITLSVRGIQTPGTQLVQDSAVPLYIDGVYIARTYGSNAAAIDLERIEVLRGPQGTLFGRNSVGGAVSLITRRPTPRFEGYVEGEIGNYGTLNLTGLVNVPLGFSAGLRVLYSHDQYDPQASGPNGRVFNSLNQEYVRATLGVDFAPGWDAFLTVDHFDVVADPPLVKLRFFNPASPFNALLPARNGNPDDRLTNYIERGDFYNEGFSEGVPDTVSEGFSATGTINGRIGDDVNLRSITGYRTVDRDAPVDLDGTPYPLLNLPTQTAEVSQISQEFQVFGTTFGERLKYIFGLYYFQEEGRQASKTISLGGIAPTASIVDYDATNTSYAVYAQFDFSITPEITLIAGARYTDDTREIDYHDRSVVLATGVETCTLAAIFRGPGPCNAPGSVKFNYIPWTAGLTFEPNEDLLFYAKVSKSFRSGGFSQSTNALLGRLPTVAPEEVISPEAGFKLTLLDRRLRVNGAIFYANYTNIQQQIRETSPSGAPVAVQVNVGEGRLMGGELEVSALLGRLNLTAGVGILDSQYEVGPFAGTPFLYAPELSFNVGATYPIETSAGELRLSANYGYKSDQFLVSPGTTPAPRETLEQEAFGILNAEARFAFKDLPLVLTVWGRNLTESEYYTRILDFSSTPLAGVIGLPGSPRTYGASLRFSF